MASPDWIEILDRPRPIEADALRLLVLTDRLGSDPEGGRGEARESHDLVRVVVGETLLAHLDQLVRRPINLAYLLLDLFDRRPELADRRIEMARRVRRLLATDRQLRQPVRRRRPWKSAADALEESRRRHPFTPPRWQRLDAPVAFLASRGLMRVHVVARNGPDRDAPSLGDSSRNGAGSTEHVLTEHALTVYGLTGAGENLLRERVYPEDRDIALVLQVCDSLGEVLPLTLASGEDGVGGGAGEPGEILAAELEQVGRRLDAFRRDAQIPLERDPLPELFQSIFRERL